MTEQQAQACAAYGTPGQQHAQLAQFAGTWKSEAKHWMGPGEPTITHGKMVCEMINNGLYLHQVFEGEFQGAPFHGRGLSGFNLASGKYENIWCDSAGSGMMISQGTHDESRNVFEASGTMPNPEGGGDMQFRDVTTIESADKHVMEMFFTFPGAPDEMKVMEITFTRA